MKLPAACCKFDMRPEYIITGYVFLGGEYIVETNANSSLRGGAARRSDHNYDVAF